MIVSGLAALVGAGLVALGPHASAGTGAPTAVTVKGGPILSGQYSGMLSLSVRVTDGAPKTVKVYYAHDTNPTVLLDANGNSPTRAPWRLIEQSPAWRTSGEIYALPHGYDEHVDGSECYAVQVLSDTASSPWWYGCARHALAPTDVRIDSATPATPTTPRTVTVSWTDRSAFDQSYVFLLPDGSGKAASYTDHQVPGDGATTGHRVATIDAPLYNRAYTDPAQVCVEHAFPVEYHPQPGSEWMEGRTLPQRNGTSACIQIPGATPPATPSPTPKPSPTRTKEPGPVCRNPRVCYVP